MPIGFLQGFDEDSVLAMRDMGDVTRAGYTQGLHLAMLGLTHQAHAIFTLLYERRPELPWGSGPAIRLFYHAVAADAASRSQETTTPPFDISADDVDALQRTFVSKDTPANRDVTPRSLSAARGDLDNLVRGDKYGHADAATGYKAMQVSAALTSALYEAGALASASGDAAAAAPNTAEAAAEEAKRELLAKAASRIGANCQAQYLATLLAGWRELFLPGRLREALGAGAGELETYAEEVVLRTLWRRLDEGPAHPDEVYGGWGMRELLGELERNTLAGIGGDGDGDGDEEGEMNEDDWEDDGEGGKKKKKSILSLPVSDEAIAEKEAAMDGREMPEEMREFYRITNGCRPVRCEGGFRHLRFVPLEDVFLEDDDYMDDYTMNPLPDLNLRAESRIIAAEEEEGKRKRGEEGDDEGARKKEKKTEEDEDNPKQDDDSIDLEVDWRAHSGGGAIAMYEHDGQGTEYTWIVPRAAVEAAKARLADVYARVDDRRRALLDRAVADTYGSREAYDGMREYAVFVQPWGDPHGRAVYPSFMSYVRAVVYASRVAGDKSPLAGRGLSSSSSG